MFVVEIYAAVRHFVFIEGHSRREAARVFGLNRETVRSNVWTCPGASSIGSDARQGLRHYPTVKPTVLLEDALLDLTHRGGIVLDPFLGSGSTLLAAETTGRLCRGIEIDPLYIDLTIRRWEAATGSEAVRVQG